MGELDLFHLMNIVDFFKGRKIPRLCWVKIARGLGMVGGCVGGGCRGGESDMMS